MRAPLQLHHRTLRRSLLIVLASALAACGATTATLPPAAAPTATAAPNPTTAPAPHGQPGAYDRAEQRAAKRNA